MNVRSHRLIRHAGLACAVALALACVLPAVASADTTWSITGRGWGHGIGMSQWGAKGYAEAGWSYKNILTHYYRSTTVSQLFKPGTAVADNPLIYVNLDASKANRASWTVLPGTAGQRLVINGVVAPATTAYTFKASGSTVYVYASNGTLWKTLTGTVGVRQQSGDLVQVVDASGPDPNTYNVYRGFLRVTGVDSKVKLVNAVPLESYLRGVVPCESGSTWHIESLKAQAVAARSYAFDSAYPDGTAPGGVAATPKELYCTTYSQVYRGVGKGADRTALTTVWEKATTDLAISSTNAMMVWYSGSPVKTFFFSSSGGYTGSLEELWGPSSDPYWGTVNTSVIDQYEASAVSPTNWAISWGAPIKYTGTALASKLGYSSPVVAVTVTRGSGNFVKTVTLRLANGTVLSFTADRFRSKLGLKSCKFWIAGAATIPAGSTRHEDDDERFSYAGSWGVVSLAQYSGGSGRFSGNAGDVLTVPFRGTAVSITGPYAANLGMAEIVIDGISRGTVSQYASVTSFNQILWVQTGLRDGWHSLEIKVKGTKDTAASDDLVVVDSVHVLGTVQRADSTRSENDDARLARTGTWVTPYTSAASGGSYTHSKVTGSTLVVPFRGTGIDIVGTLSPLFGRGEVLVDGVSRGTFSAYSPSVSYKQCLFSVSGLASGVHTMTVRVTGSADASSGGVYVGLDAFDVSGGSVRSAGTVRVEDGDSRLGWTGTWSSVAHSDMSGDSYRVSTAAGSSVTVAFTGTSISVVGAQYSTFGKAEILLDGVSKGTIDLYAPELRSERLLYRATGLSSGSHRLTVKVTGTRNAASKGTMVDIDAFDVAGTISSIPNKYEESDARIVFGEGWQRCPSASLSGGSMRFSTTSSASVGVAFRGDSISLYGPKAVSYGRANVYLDGVLRATVNLKSSSTAFKQLIWSVSGLDPATRHDVRLEVVGDGYVGLDYAYVGGEMLPASAQPAPAAMASVEETDTRIVYSTGWKSFSTSAAFGGTMRYATASGSKAAFTFTGTEFEVYGVRAPGYGTVRVYVDGILYQSIYTRSTTVRYGEIVASRAALAPGVRHTVSLVAAGDGVVGVDRIRVRGAW